MLVYTHLKCGAKIASEHLVSNNYLINEKDLHHTITLFKG